MADDLAAESLFTRKPRRQHRTLRRVLKAESGGNQARTEPAEMERETSRCGSVVDERNLEGGWVPPGRTKKQEDFCLQIP